MRVQVKEKMKEYFRTCNKVPDTTVPTPGTENVSSIWNSAGSPRLHFTRVDNRFKNIFNRSMFSPDTFDTWNIGHIL